MYCTVARPKQGPEHRYRAYGTAPCTVHPTETEMYFEIQRYGNPYDMYLLYVATQRQPAGRFGGKFRTTLSSPSIDVLILYLASKRYKVPGTYHTYRALDDMFGKSINFKPLR